MSEIPSLVNTLKRQLRKQQVTYQHIAYELGMSEASVKRMFSKNSFSLERIETICGLIDWDLFDLTEATRQREHKIDSLTEQQETEIAQDLELLLVAVAVINGFGVQDIQDHYNMPEHICIQKLALLDRLKVIDLLPGNRIKLKISPNFRWRKGGAIQTYFLNVVAKEFFNSDFSGEQEKLLVVNAMLSDHSHTVIRQKMDKLAKELTQAMQQDSQLPTTEKKGNTLVLAFRHWSYTPFDALYR